MRVRSQHGCDAAVEVPAHRDLLRRRLRVNVDEDLLDALELPKRGLDLGEGRAAGPQVEVAAQVDDAEAHAVALDHAGPVAGLASQVVGGPHDARLAVEVWVDLTAVVGVVAERDRVDAGSEHLVGDLRGDAEAARRVLAVDDHERRRVELAQNGQTVEQRVPSQPADDIADEQDAGRAVPGSGAVRGTRGRRRRPIGGRLGLSHTLGMTGGK